MIELIGLVTCLSPTEDDDKFEGLFLEHQVEVLQKPIDMKDLIDIIEDKAIYFELES